MPSRPEYIHGRRSGGRSDHDRELALQGLEGAIEVHLRRYPGTAFILHESTDAELVDEIIRRYESVGWRVELIETGNGRGLQFAAA